MFSRFRSIEIPKDLDSYSIRSRTMAEKKAVIKNADMSEDMQQDAIDCATQALEKYNIEKDIAAFIKKEFDRKYVPALFTEPCTFIDTRQLGIVSLVAISARTLRTSRSTSFTSTWARSPFFCSSLARARAISIRQGVGGVGRHI